MTTLAARLEGVEVRVAGKLLLGPLDLEIVEGEHLLLSGPSGSGKTTLLRALAGLVRPSEGRVEWFGEPASAGSRLLLPPARRGVGFLFQGGGLWPHMSVRRTLAFTLRARGTPRQAVPERIAELLGQVELEGFEDRLPGTLSGGEAQRLALARALAVDPRMLLLDEPLGPLDAALRGSLIEMLGRLQARPGLTSVHVTHDPEEAAAIASRRLLLVEGRLAAPVP